MSKDLLTEVLDGIQALHSFLTSDLANERLSPENDQKRRKNIELLAILRKKICSTDPSIRPRVNTPAGKPKPPAPAPSPSTLGRGIGKPPPPVPPPEEEEGGEMYVECEPCDREGDNALPEEYLEFEPTHVGGDGEGAQEMYEAMNPDDQIELYEEPVIPTASPPSRTPSIPQGDSPTDLYEEPIISLGGPPNFKPPTPGSSRENSGSGAIPIQQRGSMMMDEVPPMWEYDLSVPKGQKTKVSELKKVLIKGPLEKLGGRNQSSWQKRYCVLSGAFMYFYEKESSKTFNNRIALPNYMVSTAPKYTNEKKKQFAFKLTHTDSTGKQKDYFFRAHTSDLHTKWLQLLGKTLQKVSEKANRVSRVSATMPAPSKQHQQFSPLAGKPRAMSFEERDDDQGGDIYEDITPQEEVEQDEYVAVSPSHEEDPEEEYIDVNPVNEEDIEQDNYEAPSFDLSDLPPSSFRPPPPVLPPPPSTLPTPPTHPPPSQRRQAPEPMVDTSKVYVQGQNGIRYEHVFVILWDFVAGANDELNLKRGDLVYVADAKEGSDWWYGDMLDDNATATVGQTGFFPSTYSVPAFEAVSS